MGKRRGKELALGADFTRRYGERVCRILVTAIAQRGDNLCLIEFENGETKVVKRAEVRAA